MGRAALGVSKILAESFEGLNREVAMNQPFVANWNRRDFDEEIARFARFRHSGISRSLTSLSTSGS